MKAPLLDRLALSFASTGLAISSALTLSHTSKVPLPCGGGSGCETVAHDPSSVLFGVPVSVFGLFAYLLLTVLAAIRIWSVKGRSDLSLVSTQRSVYLGAAISSLGAIVSIGLTYYAIAHIHATCAWCLGSLGMMLGSTATYIALLKVSSEPASNRRPITAIPWAILPIVLVSGIAIWGGRTKSAAPDLSSVRLDLVSFDDVLHTSHLLGSPTAPITIAEFGDLMCPACRDMHGRVMKFIGKYPTKVALLFHHFPLASEAGHELSVPAAIMSERLSDTNFWSFVNQVYESDSKPTQADLNEIVASLKNKPTKTESEAKKAVTDEIALGAKYGVRQTPTYLLFIHHKPEGVATSTNLAQVLSQKKFADIIHGTD